MTTTSRQRHKPNATTGDRHTPTIRHWAVVANRVSHRRNSILLLHLVVVVIEEAVLVVHIEEEELEGEEEEEEAVVEGREEKIFAQTRNLSIQQSLCTRFGFFFSFISVLMIFNFYL